MNRVVPLVVALPLLGAAVSLLALRHRSLQRAVSFVLLPTSLAVAVSLLVHVERTDTAAVARIGGWPSAIGITYVADRLATLMLVIAMTVLLVVLVFAVGQRSRDEVSPYYHPAYLVLTAGIAAAFLAGDLFHLFVAFEVLLMASYVLLTLHGGADQVRSGTTYVVLNTIESLLLVSAVGLVYGATGTLSMAELPERLAALDDGVRIGLHLLLLVAFGLKAAVFPLFFWLPDSYPVAPSPVTAVFAGLLTKIGVYAMIRTQTLLFPDELRPVLLYVAGFTMIVGVLGAIAQSDIKRILSFHIVSQVGYMVLGLAIGGPAAVAATVFYLLHHIPVKTSLFLVEGIVEHTSGTSVLDRIGGLARRSGWLAALFLFPALSLAGLPPLSGFVGKLGLITAGLDAGQYVIVGVAIVGSLLTLVSMTKIWTGAFWGEVAPPPATAAAPAGDGPGLVEGGPGLLRRHRTMATATATLVAGSLVLAAAAGPLYAFCERTARDLTDPGAYTAEVRGS
ncbi:MAG: Na+/H+ antiporter subunit D [Acidimicrobiia bacterium]|nr:Na+/H+ antiporter subunit D [Acidimicrobiia bacterium]